MFASIVNITEEKEVVETFFLTLQETFKGSNLKKEGTLSKKTKRAAESFHTRNYISDWKPGRNNMDAPSVSKHLKALPLLQCIN